MTTKRNKTLCVFCSSSDEVSDFIKAEAALFGKLVAEKGYNLLYGGTAQGLMRVVADSYKAADGFLIGVIPTYMTDTELLKSRFKSGAASLCMQLHCASFLSIFALLTLRSLAAIRRAIWESFLSFFLPIVRTPPICDLTK
ncbi:MAG: hypothetical protein IKP71_12430, partial [Candidatus Riflebacteria bacterium]|nr:hypothetical protein [Candidatus Riflebacteria bacterium]